MKIAIVKDAGCIDPAHFWSTVWTNLCIENDIPYHVFDSDLECFMRDIVSYKPDFTLWRSSHAPETKAKDVFQRQTLDKVMGFKIIPDWNMRYLYDNKVSQTYLFQLFDIPHPETKVFFNKQDAEQYLRTAKYPFVVKANAGAGSKSFRFCENYDGALKQLEENFTVGLAYSNRDFREKGMFYAQEYYKIDGIWRIVMISNNVGYSFYQSNRPGTLIASSQGFDSYPQTPIELLDLAADINTRMNWDYMMYDILYTPEKKPLILELTDTCGYGHSSKRTITHYKTRGEWVEKQSNATPAELIFRKYIQ